jgi:PLP dependent protein
VTFDKGAINAEIMAVSKGRDAEAIRGALAQGYRLFGENRVQEAQDKWPALRAEFPDARLHFIGHLQTNKARDAVRLFDCIETVDSERLATALAEAMREEGRRLPCLIQVNTGEEPQKGGIKPADVSAFYDFCVKEAGLEIQGLMCIPPEGDIPDLHFALLRKMRDALKLPVLSMGMSGDYEIALCYGATRVRLGTILFGQAGGAAGSDARRAISSR